MGNPPRVSMASQQLEMSSEGILRTCPLPKEAQFFTAVQVHMTWSALVAQTVKNLPALQETWVRSLAWDEPLEEEMATHSRTLA